MFEPFFNHAPAPQIDLSASLLMRATGPLQTVFG